MQLGLDLVASLGSSTRSHLLSRIRIGQPGRVDPLGESLILAGDALGRIDDEQCDVGVVDRSQCTDERVVLGRIVDLALRRMPAVSTKTIGPSSVSTSVSIASRVVPAMSCTTERSSPTSRLNSVLLPTFGRPTIATRGAPMRRRRPQSRRLVSPRSRWARGLVGEPFDHDVEQVAGTSSVQCADREWIAEPEREELPEVVSRRLLSALLATTITSCWPRRSQSATSVVFHEADRRIDDEQHEVGLGDGCFDLLAHLVVESFRRPWASTHRCRSPGTGRRASRLPAPCGRG